MPAEINQSGIFRLKKIKQTIKSLEEDELLSFVHCKIS